VLTPRGNTPSTADIGWRPESSDSCLVNQVDGHPTDAEGSVLTQGASRKCARYETLVSRVVGTSGCLIQGIKRTRMFAPMGIFALAFSPLNPQAFPHGGLVTKGSMPLLPIRLHLPTLVLRLGHSYGGQVSYLGSP